MEYLKCPFCHEVGFDAVGLKGHFEDGYCNVYEATNTCQEERARWMKGVGSDG